MDKYINADKLFTKLDTMKNPDSEFATDDYIDGFSDGVSAAMKEVKEMPSADIVEVVRCKDCKYAYINSFAQLSGVVACKHLADKSDGILYAMQQDDFCSYGEKRNS